MTTTDRAYTQCTTVKQAHTALVREVRRMSMAAYNTAWSWNDHPSYNDRAGVLHSIDMALGAHTLLMNLTGDYADPYRAMLTDLRAIVKARKPGTRMDLSGLPRPTTPKGA